MVGGEDECARAVGAGVAGRVAAHGVGHGERGGHVAEAPPQAARGPRRRNRARGRSTWGAVIFRSTQRLRRGARAGRLHRASGVSGPCSRSASCARGHRSSSIPDPKKPLAPRGRQRLGFTPEAGSGRLLFGWRLLGCGLLRGGFLGRGLFGGGLLLAGPSSRRAFSVEVAMGNTPRHLGNILKYLNRLSDYLFVLARYCNHVMSRDDSVWQPSGSFTKPDES